MEAETKRHRVENSSLVINGVLSDFKTRGAHFTGLLTNEGHAYFDRTRYISVLNRFIELILFFRPRRFGKSVTVNMLEHFHGIQYTDVHQSFYEVRYYVATCWTGLTHRHRVSTYKKILQKEG